MVIFCSQGRGQKVAGKGVFATTGLLREELVAQLVICMESWVRSPVPHKTRHKAGVAVQTCDLITKEMEMGGSKVQGYLHLHNEFKANTK